MKKILSTILICTMTLSVLSGCGSNSQTETPNAAETQIEEEPQAEAETQTEVETVDTYNCQLYGTVTDAGEVVSHMVIDFGDDKRVVNVADDTFTVHATASIGAFLEGTELEIIGDYDIDRTVVKTETDGQKVTVYFDMSEGLTLVYATSANKTYPADLTYTITQNKPITLTTPDGTTLTEEYIAEYSCDNIVVDEETSKFESIMVNDGVNYQFYNAGADADKLVIWFHGGGEGDLLESGNNVVQILANRGGVAWATEEFQEILGGAYVMAFQAPDVWYTAQRDNLLDKVAAEIKDVVEKYNINPDKIVVAGCSAGGYMATRMLIAYPELFKAAIINCPAYEIASDNGGETPTDEELTAIKNSNIPIWLVQGATDSGVATADPADLDSKRFFDILIQGEEVAEFTVKQELEQNSDFTTYETADGKYKLTLYDTTEDGKLRFAEDYDQDGIMNEVQYSDHKSWIYTLRNNPQAADGTHIVNWAAGFVNQ